MEDMIPFGSRLYGLLLVLLVFCRGMDFLSTWVATPHLELEGNPIAKKLGWKWGIPVNGLLCFLFAFWPLPAIVICTTSVLVAARNFQSAWLMRSMGEHQYRLWHVERLRETRITLYLFCLFAQTLLTGALGGAVVLTCDWQQNPVIMAVGLGIIAYAIAVTVYSLLGVWRLRRSSPESVASSQLLQPQTDVSRGLLVPGTGNHKNNGNGNGNGNGKLSSFYPAENTEPSGG